jgi:D-sedoheptulose 7-phosphate isomerase
VTKSERPVDSTIETTSESSTFLGRYFDRIATLAKEVNIEEVAALAEAILSTIRTSGQVFFIGNGGSASTATHYVNDLVMATVRSGRKLRAVSLSDNISLITGIGNDYGYDDVFAYQLRAFGEPGDLVVAISASGNSPNLVAAFQYASSAGMRTAAVVGFNGGVLKQMAGFVVHISSDIGEYGPVEDLHLVINHAIASWLSERND